LENTRRFYIRPRAGRNNGRELNLERRRLCENRVEVGHLGNDVDDISGARRRPAGTGGVESGVSKRSVDESGKNLRSRHQSRALSRGVIWLVMLAVSGGLGTYRVGEDDGKVRSVSGNTGPSHAGKENYVRNKVFVAVGSETHR
jgi:hypothetical protein